jgi:hypothetical protein
MGKSPTRGKTIPASVKKQIRQKIDDSHRATAAFLELCIDAAKHNPKTLSKVEKSMKQLIKNADQLDKVYERMLK